MEYGGGHKRGARVWNYVFYGQVNVGEGMFFIALESRSCYHLRRVTRLFFKRKIRDICKDCNKECDEARWEDKQVVRVRE